MEYTKNTQAYAWILEINNPEKCGETHEKIIGKLQKFNPDYFCLADEVGERGTYHTHIYLHSRCQMRFGTVKNRFPTAHIEKARGNSQENRDYIRKEGRWAGTSKEETKVEGTFVEYGDMPTVAAEESPKMYQILEEVKEGRTTIEIINNHPSYAFRGKDIDALRESVLAEKYMIENRKVTTVYLYGDSGTGKTRSIFANHSPRSICRVTNYSGGIRFDAYHGQEVLVFEEFHSQVPIEMMLNFLDIYPIMLPARYCDKVACYTTVYITSNLDLEDQYKEIQEEKPETWKAFLRRIHIVREFRRNQPVREEVRNGEEYEGSNTKENEDS